MSEANKDKVREQFIKIASEKFAKFGFKKTSLDDIARVTRRGKTAIYYYFKNKEDIFRAVIEKEAEELATAIRNSVLVPGTPEERFRRYVFARMNALKNVANFYTAMKSELFDHLDFMNLVREKYQREETDLVKYILAEGVKKKVFHSGDHDKTAEIVVILLKGMEIPLFIDDKDNHLEDKLNAFIQLIMSGLIKR